MIQDQLFKIKAVEGHKYQVIHNNKLLTAWFMGGYFTFPNYRQEKQALILQDLGTAEEVFK